MIKYILKRILMMIPVILGISFVIFFALEMAEGDPISVRFPDAVGETYEALRHQYGYDRSVFYRYAMYIFGLLKGDLGTSISMNAPVWDVYMSRLPATVDLAIASSLVCLIISIPIGIISAVKHGTLIDNGSMVFALLGLSMPNFWLGLLLIIVFAQKLGWFPSYGREVWYSIFLPAFTVGTGHTAVVTRTTRSSMLDVIRQDYLRTARMKGVSEKKVITKHALKNALIPIVTICGSNFAGILGGAALTETVFTWPGVGRLVIDAIGQRDVPLATGCIMMTCVLSSIILLIIDILYAYLDPRIKGNYTKGKKKKA